MNPVQTRFYVTGGTLRGDASCYVPRRADRDLYEGLNQGEYCYVLNSRQMGKSSLMVRTAQRLRQEGVDVVVLDLTAIGSNNTAEQWYYGLLGHLIQQLRVEDEAEEFWQDKMLLAPLQRWMRVVREVVLPRCRGQLVIFVDEIDAVLSLPFSTDEFFAAIRECYNRRSEDPELARLAFCLLGVATPSDLIRDTRTTPFNIGRRVELLDFTEAEAAPLAQGLGRDDRLAAKLLRRILYWTGGHPYLTQRLCLTVAQDASVVRPSGVDRVCEELFLSHRARERDDNLLFVRERILRSDVDRAGLLELYQQVRSHKRVRDDETSPLASILRLSGIARVVEGYMWVRNRIYYRVFDREWVQENMPDAEKRRQRRAYRRGLLRASAVAAVLFALTGAALCVWLDGKVWDRVSYFNTLAKRQGMYEGVGRLNGADVAARAVSLRFHRKGRYGPVVRVEAVDSRGELNPRHNVGTYLRNAEEDSTPLLLRACQWEFVLDNQEQVVQEKAMDKLGRLVWAFIYTRLPGMPVRGHFVGPNGYLQDQRRSTAEYVEIEYSADGFERVRRYYDGRGARRPGPDNAYGLLQEYDRRGMVIKMTSLDAEDRPMNDAAGNSGMVLEPDALGNVLKARSFDKDGRPAPVNRGFTGYEARYDVHGNLSDEAYFDESGKPVRIELGFAKKKSQYDGRGNLIEEAYFDESGKPALNKDRYAAYTATHDERGNWRVMTYFDCDRNRTKCADGFAQAIAEYDDRGNQIEQAFLDESAKLTLHLDGNAMFRAKYDEGGNVTEMAYFDCQRKPTKITAGYAKYTARYDPRGHTIEQTYFDENSKPILVSAGYARYQAKYDERGNQTELVYFGRDYRRVKIANGYAEIKTRYDERGNPIELAYFDEKDKPARYGDGYTKSNQVYDDRGKLVEDLLSGYDAGKLGISQRRRKYDERGRIIEVANLDAYGETAQDMDGHARWKNSYDAEGHQTEIAFFNRKGDPAPYEDGYTAWRKSYDRGKLVEQVFLGYASSNAFAKRVCKFNQNELCVEQTYLDASDRPAREQYGSTKTTRSYDETGKAVEETHWGFDGSNGFAKVIVKFNGEGLGVEYNFFDAADKPTRHKHGYLRKTRRFDERNKPVEDTFWGYDGSSGFSKMIATLDNQELEREHTYFDANDKPVRHNDGNTGWTRNYDASGKPVEEIYSGYNGSNGFAKMIAKLNDKELVVENTYFDGAERPTRHKEGFLRKTRNYDQSGKAVEETFWGYDGSKGFTKMIVKLDDKELRLEQTYFDAADSPTRHKYGHSRMTERHDEGGKPIERTYWGFDGRDGFAKLVVTLNDKGLEVGHTFFDANDKPVRHKDGNAGWTRNYDASGKAVEDTCWGYDGSRGFTLMIVKLNDKGLGVENTYFNGAEQPVRHRDGFTKWTRKYDEIGKLVEETYSGYDGSKGFAKLVAKHNDKGFRVEDTYFDAEGRPTRHKDGFTKWTRKYDEFGKTLEETFWGYDGNNGFTKMVVKLNSKGLRVEHTYLDEADRPTRHIRGYTRVDPEVRRCRNAGREHVLGL